MLSHKVLLYGPSVTITDRLYKPEMQNWLRSNCKGGYMYERYPNNRCHVFGFKCQSYLDAFEKEFANV